MDRKLNKSGRELRKRGRPAGKNRVPLSLKERRARNAQYERERRIELTQALTDLAEAAGCDSSISSADLLATVISQLASASQRKHSSDADSLRRCNKNLIAQIADLEQRLASDPNIGVDIFPPRTAEIVERPRQGKRKWDNFQEEETEYTPLPKYSPPERDYSPPQSFSPEHKYLPERRPFPDQMCLPEQVFKPEPKYSPKHEFTPIEQHLPTGQSRMTHQFWLPVPKLSPLSDSSGPLSPEQSTLDYSSYQFAGAQVPTPEYQISCDTPEYILPEQRCSLHQDVCNVQQGFWPSRCSELTSPDEYAPSPLIAAESHYPAPYMHQPLTVIQPPIRHDIVSSLGTLPENEESITPDIIGVTSTSGLDQRPFEYLSTEDLISVYL